MLKDLISQWLPTAAMIVFSYISILQIKKELKLNLKADQVRREKQLADETKQLREQIQCQNQLMIDLTSQLREVSNQMRQDYDDTPKQDEKETTV